MATTGARDVIQENADALTALIQSVTEVTGTPLYVYDVEEIKFEQGKGGFDLPAVTVLYNSMTLAGADKRGTAADLIFDVYLIAGRDRTERQDQKAGTVKSEGTQALSAIRQVLLADCTKAPSGRAWEFMREQPVGIDEDWIVYLQRWRTRVMTIC